LTPQTKFRREGNVVLPIGSRAKRGLAKAENVKDIVK